MVFTIVTIVFLPMSFIAAIFTIPIRDFPHEDGAPSIPFSYVSSITFGIGLAISIPLIVVAFTFENLGVLFKRFLLFWRNFIRQEQSSRPHEDANDEDHKVVQATRRSEEVYRSRSSYDVEPEMRPMRRSIYSKDRSFDLRNGIRRISGDLERGNLGSYDFEPRHP